MPTADCPGPLGASPFAVALDRGAARGSPGPLSAELVRPLVGLALAVGGCGAIALLGSVGAIR